MKQVREYPRDEEGRIIVNMVVKDDTNFLSVFSSGDTPVISGEAAEFLESSTRAIPLNERLALHVKSDCIDGQEQKIYKSAIREYYTEQLCANEHELRTHNVIAIILAVLGVVVLALAVLLDQFEAVLWSEVVDIAAWVFLWESVDIFFFKTRELKGKRKRYSAFLKMKITYEKLT